jgi:tripartite ATP-independent transporter DctP family solute receptor
MRREGMTFSRRDFLKTVSAASLTATGISAPINVFAQSKITLRMSSSLVADNTSAHFVWYQRLVDNLKASVGDKIGVDYFPNNQLGKEADVVQQVKVGAVDMMISGSSIWSTVAPELGLFDMGYLFNSYAQAGKALDGAAGSQLAKILNEKTGVTILGWAFSFGARNVFAKKPLASLADVKGLKLRVLPATNFVETFKVMEAVPTPIPFGELYTSLQTGVVDGFEHDAPTALGSKFYEVTKHCLLTEHVYNPVVPVIGKTGLERIPADLRAAFMKAVAEATAYQRSQATATEAKRLMN